MKVLITGSNGFIGSNLKVFLNNLNHEVLEFDVDTHQKLDTLVKQCDFVMHLAGINRVKVNDEYNFNIDLTKDLLNCLYKNPKPILFTSSIQANLDNDYGKSKKTCEDLIFKYSNDLNTYVYVYRLTNAFGKWSRPNYNSVIATWCYNISHDLDIVCDDLEKKIEFVYIDDICKEFINCLNQKGSLDILHVPITYKRSLGYIKETLYNFKNISNTLLLPDFKDDFIKKLYSTYLSYLDKFTYELIEHRDNRGSFSEVFKTLNSGQFSINVIKANVIKGGHYHHTKVEKFLVLKGKCLVRFLNIKTKEIKEIILSDEKLTVLDIPVGYSHTIKNISNSDAYVLIWANELFDINNQDTYIKEIQQ